MKFKVLLVAFLAAAVSFVACNKEEELGSPRITVDPTELSFGQGEGSQNINLVSTRPWLVKSQPDWVALNPTTGAASTKTQVVSVSVAANSGYDRTAELVLTNGFADAAIQISQAGAAGELKKGSGTKDDPYTVAGVVAYVKSLGNDVNSPEKVYVKGIVSNIEKDADTYTGSGTFGNATFKISDDGTSEGDQFYCYRILYLGNRKFKSGDTDIKVGSNVVILGNVVNFKGNTPETAQGTAFLYSLDGKSEGDGSVDAGTPSGKGTKDDPFNVAAAYEAVKNLKWNSTTDYQKVGPYYVKGKVSTIDQDYTYNISDGRTYGNARFNISEDGSESAAQFTLYNLNYLGDTKFTQGKKDIKKGDDVVICAELMNYRNNTPENAGGYLYSLNGDTGSTTPSSTVTGTITETIAVEDGSGVVVPEAIVAALSSQGFIATDGQSNVYVYLKAEPAVKIGDKVKIEGTKTTYYGLPEFTNPTATVLASGVEVPRTALKDITSTIDAYNASVAEFICVTGKLVEDGNFFNVEVGGAARKATPSSLHSSINPKSLVGQQVTMTGYFNTIHSGKNLVQIVVTSITPADPNAKYCSVEPASINVKADATSASFKITANAAWTAVSDNAAFTVEPASGSADATVAVKFSANEGDAARVANIKVSCPDAGFEGTVVVTQAKPSSGDAMTLSIDFTKEMADLPQASANGITDGTYTWEGQTFILHAADKFYQAKSNDNFYLLIGKTNSYIQFPAIAGKALTKVSFKTGANASTAVIEDIAKADGTRLNINTKALDKGKEYEWEVPGEPGAAYRIMVCNDKNAQFQNLTLVYE